uniref:Uncharacterized protein n=1 Tax=Lactuca sativa TaxID=4236 RepID=A0A9R1UQ70_LACSA|nr:hypothetical protein LSAT_V11C800435030 [Lactuca sativa]
MLMVILAVGTKLQSILTKMALEITERHAVIQGIPLREPLYEYKINSCFHDNMKLVILKLVLGVGVLILCSYITLPLYALLSQVR